MAKPDTWPVSETHCPKVRWFQTPQVSWKATHRTEAGGADSADGQENSGWGYDRIVGAMANLDYRVSGNLVLDELDRELERLGHRFVRFADDSNIYVRSERAGQRVMESVTRFITQKLKLKVNEAKSAMARPQERKFLGFSFTEGPAVKRTIAPKALATSTAPT